jgi:hypothetical protein
MARFPRELKVALAITTVVFAALLWPIPASTRGERAARRDIAGGHYVLLGYGLPTVYQAEYTRLLRERYGIEYRAAAGCVVSESLISYVNAYDVVVVAAANRKFGHDVFRDSSEEAMRNFELKSPQLKTQ